MRTAAIRSTRTLGNAMREFRLESGMSQRELAQAIGVHPRNIVELEGGKGTKALERLFDYLREVDAEIVIKGRKDA